MGIREALNERSKLVSAAVAVAVVLCAGWMTVWFVSGNSDVSQGSAQAFYTIDDGKTWFRDDADKLPPYTHNGATAYRCYVFTCDGGKTRFVSHLERCTPEGKRLAEEQMKQGKRSPGSAMMRRLAVGSMEFKKPGTGDQGWISENDPAAADLKRPKCPDGTTNNLEPVWP